MNKSFLIELEMGEGRKALFTSLDQANATLRKHGMRLVETVTGLAIKGLPVRNFNPAAFNPIPVQGGGYAGGQSRDVRAVQLARKQGKSALAVQAHLDGMRQAGSRVMGETSNAQYGRQGRNKK